MKKIMLLLFALSFACVIGAAEKKSEQRVLDDLLVRINDPALNKQIRLLSRLNPPQFAIHPFQYSASFKNNKLEPTAEDQKNGFVTFIASSESKIPHNYNPTKDEIDAKMVLLAARNTYTAGFFGFVPLAEGTTDATFKVSPLKNEAGDLLDPAAVKIFLVQHLFMTMRKMAFNYYPEPHGLEPITSNTPIKLRDKVSESIYIEFKIPKNAKPGLYTGELEFAANNVTVKKPIELKVYDFELPKLKPGEMNWGFYGSYPSVRDYQFLSEHGVNTISVKFSLTDDKLEQNMKLLRENGIDGVLQIQVGGNFSSPANSKAKKYSSEWKRIYGEGVKKFNERMLAMGETNDRWFGIIFDEPRETMPNPWNISFAETMIYYDLLGEYAPGLQRVANPTSDGPKKAIAQYGDSNMREFPDGVYTEFVKPPRAMDLIHIHYGKSSANMIKYARENNIPVWGFSDGDNRYAWGIQNFKLDLHGRLIYAYFGKPSYSATPLYPIQMTGYEFAGRAATPPYNLSFSDTIWSTCKLKNMRDGITDYHYFYLLDQLVKAKPADPVASEARQYMSDLLKRMPEYASDIDNISEYEVGTSESGSMGMDVIKRKLADYIDKLK